MSTPICDRLESVAGLEKDTTGYADLMAAARTMEEALNYIALCPLCASAECSMMDKCDPGKLHRQEVLHARSTLMSLRNQWAKP
jgi:hypothetical protein